MVLPSRFSWSLKRRQGKAMDRKIGIPLLRWLGILLMIEILSVNSLTSAEKKILEYIIIKAIRYAPRQG